MVQTRAQLESLCKNLVENVKALTNEYNKNTKINFEVATEELIKHLSIDLLELLEQPSIENDVKVSSFLRRLNFPIQSIMLLKDNTDKKSKLIIAASSLDLLQDDMEGEEKEEARDTGRTEQENITAPRSRFKRHRSTPQPRTPHHPSSQASCAPKPTAPRSAPPRRPRLRIGRRWASSGCRCTRASLASHTARCSCSRRSIRQHRRP